MVDYSKFDGIGSSDDEEEAKEPPHPPTHGPLPAHPPPPHVVTSVTPKGSEGGRLRFEHEGRTVYEWEQSLEDVTLYVVPPPGVKASMIACTITHTHLSLGLKGMPHPFIDEATGGPVKAAESFWTLEDGELHITLQKATKGQVWPSALAGRGALDPITSETVRKQLLLERFQEENPGFDFSNAQFNGTVPDPETFLGGAKYS